MDDLNDLALFALVVEHAGFAAVERETGIPKSRLSRRVSALEESLGVRLLQRSTRRFAVTDVGLQVYRHARAMREEAEAARMVVAELSGEPSGLLKVSCPVALAQVQLAEVLPAFLARYPKVRLQLMVSNRRVDVIDEGIDIALRVRNRIDEDPGLIVRQFGATRELLVASPGYLGLHGEPTHPSELAGHSILSMIDDPGTQRWELHNSEGRTARVEFEPRVAAKDFPTLRHLAMHGLGVALLPETMCQEQFERNHLQRVLPAWDLPLGICHAVFASRRGMLPALRAFIDHLAAEIPRTLPRQGQGGSQPSKPLA
ncbi:LysR family transcriptional regulator [Pseudomarimonas salicorniae]|uniref:LysR family transcriptional regulator n=1 Tax=Pseudomarimonas salicorniae TaxID=2933270 RepID=UPI0031BBA433